MKKGIIILLLLIVPILVHAQVSGGQISRKAQTTTAHSVRNSSQKPGANSIGMSESKRKTIVANIVSNMVNVKGGTFIMGPSSSEQKIMNRYFGYEKNLPTHQVSLGDFYIGRYEVTQEEWEAVMGERLPSFKEPCKPATPVSWDMCQVFIRKLNSLTGKNFRLPTEAEWEFAARGGNNGNGYNFSGSNNLDEVAWYSGNVDYSDGEQPVGKKRPNELGLYDMTGNVDEWCQDWYGKYSVSSQYNPHGPSYGSRRVIRGESIRGSYDGKWYYYVSCRNFCEPDSNTGKHGFRLAM